MYKKISAVEKEVKEVVEEYRKEIKVLKEQIKELQSKNTSEYEDINCKLSDFAQHAIEDSKGPLKPDMFINFLMNDIFNKRNKEILPVIRKYSNNTDGFKKQLTQVSENIETHMKYREKQKKLDDKLIKKLKKIKKTVEEEQQKEMKTGTKVMVQTNLLHYYNGQEVSCKVTHDIEYKNNPSSSKQGDVKESSSNKQGMPAKETGKCSRKRKHMIDEESSSSQESEITHITRRVSKRLKIDSSKSSAESSDNMSVEESHESAEPMIVVSSENSQSSNEPMSISDGPSSQSDEMSISEESSSQSDDNLAEISKTVKTAKKLAGKVSKQPESRLGENSPGCSRTEETVPEKHFSFRGKKSRKH